MMKRSLDAGDTNNSPLDYPPLTVLPVADDPGRYYVLGRSGWWYECRVATESEPAFCECPHRGAFCHHLAAMEQFRNEGKSEQAELATAILKAMSDEERKDIFR